jgi:hypothetical protein
LTRLPTDFSIFRIYIEVWIDLIHGVAVRHIVALVTTSNGKDLFCTFDPTVKSVLVEGDTAAETISLGELQNRHPLAARMIVEGLVEQMAGVVRHAPADPSCP